MNKSLTTITSTDPKTKWQDRCTSEVSLSLCMVCVVLRPSDKRNDGQTDTPEITASPAAPRQAGPTHCGQRKSCHSS